MRRALLLLSSVVAASTTLISNSSAQCVVGGAGGAYPGAGAVTGIWDVSLPSNPLTSTLAVTVPAGATVISGINLRGLTHTWSGDTHIVLTDPSGVNYNLLVLSDSTSPGGAGCGTDLAGDYTIVDEHSAGNACNPGALSFDCAAIYAPGIYAQRFSTWTSGNAGLLNTPLESIPIASGNWTISLYDWYPAADFGTLTNWEMCFGAPSTPVLPCPPPPVCSELTTTFVAGNGGNNGGQVFFDMTVLNPSGINLGQIAVNTGEGGAFTLDVYTKPTTYVGFTANQAAWTLLTSGTGAGAGANLPSIADLTDIVIPPGTYGVALVLDAAHGFDYTNGNGANQNYANADVSISAGAANNFPWTGTAFTPRVFNGTLRYNCLPPGPVGYCTAGTSTHGCVPAISASAQPSVSAAHACSISIANVEGQKFGIIFYGINNTGFNPAPWAVGSSSFLCVKGPTQRTPSVNSNGTLNLCNGALNLDWNAYQAANPGAVGNPWSVGNKVYVQGWYRDPPAPKTTNLSDALEMTYQP
jgi:hypothetical protein